MTGLPKFIEARLAEDEAGANEASGRSWFAHSVGDDQRWVSEVESGDDVAEPWGNEPAAYAEHIARHDPARVLRSVAAGRAILAVHHVPDRDDPAKQWCAGCGYDTCQMPDVMNIDQCPTLRAYALTWAGHPDYQAGWAP